MKHSPNQKKNKLILLSACNNTNKAPSHRDDRTSESERLTPIPSFGENSSAVLKTMLNSRARQKTEAVNEQHKNIRDFRRIGPRIENIESPKIRLDCHLAKKYPFHNRKVWRERILNSEVLVECNSPKERLHSVTTAKLIHKKPTYCIKNFDQIWFYQSPTDEPEYLETINVVFDNKDVCVFDKPPNMVVHSAGLYGKNTFIQRIAELGFTNCSPVHRIDRETSGILVCARTNETRSLISNHFRIGSIQKMYLAVTKSIKELPDYFKVSAPIGIPEKSLIRLKLWTGGINPQNSLTLFKKLASYNNTHLLACVPKTGRTNQIRIHLASRGHWIVGDKMYYEDENIFIEFYEKGYTENVHKHVLFPRHMLHNTGIFLPEINNEPIICPLPHDLMEFPDLQEMFKQNEFSLDPNIQKEQLKNLFIELHKKNDNDFVEL